MNNILNFQIYTLIMTPHGIQIRHARALCWEQLPPQLISALFRMVADLCQLQFVVFSFCRDEKTTKP
jgi:hypothetical protein